MEIKIVKEDEIKLVIDGNDGINIENVDSKILEDFVEACLQNDAQFEVDKDLESHPLAKLFNSLFTIKEPDNEFNIQIKSLDAEITQVKAQKEKIVTEIDEDDLPF